MPHLSFFIFLVIVSGNSATNAKTREASREVPLNIAFCGTGILGTRAKRVAYAYRLRIGIYAGQTLLCLLK